MPRLLVQITTNHAVTFGTCNPTRDKANGNSDCCNPDAAGETKNVTRAVYSPQMENLIKAGFCITA
jgi:hypothetical protein